MMLNLPPVLIAAIKFLAGIEFNPFKLWKITYNRPALYRLMRVERRRNLIAVLTVLLKHMDVPTGRIVRVQ